MSISKQSAGGKATAIKLRNEAIERYYQNPNKCKGCKNVIEIRPGEKVREVKIRDFCNTSCYQTYRLTMVEQNKLKTKERNCKNCQNIFIIKKCSDGSFSKKQKCDDCITIARKSRGYSLELLPYRTKGELFDNRKNWQSARTAIQKQARKVYKQQTEIIQCRVCKYSNHVEVCHIKPVSDFPNNTLISEINNINNLTGLCPNHHWEFDNGILNL